MEDIDTLTNALQQSLNAKLSQLCVDILGRVTQDLSAVSTKAPAIFGAFIMVTLRILRPLNSVTPGAGVYGCYLHPMSRLTPTPLHCFVGT
jgi:hypothetical protein